MEALLPSAYGFALVLFRISAFCAVAPLFGTKSVPARIRLALSLALALPLFSAAGAPHPPLPSSWVLLAWASAQETLVGLAGGAAARALWEAAGAAGHLAATSAGLSFGALVDPLNGAESTALSQLWLYATLGAALAFGFHREALYWLARTFLERPPGTFGSLRALGDALLTQSLYSVTLAVRLAFPLLVVSTLAHVVLGWAGRLTPQLNLSTLGFSVSLLVTMGALFVLTPSIAELAARALLSFSGLP